MTTQMEEIIIRKSPWVFITRVILIVALFTLLPLLLTVLPYVRSGYQQLSISRTVSFVVFTFTVFAFLQILALAIAFALWYFPYYSIGGKQIIHKRATLFADRILAQTSDVEGVEVKQSRFAKRLGYGTLVLHRLGGKPDVLMKGVPAPVPQAKKVQEYLSQIAHRKQPLLPASVQKIIAGGESQNVEFKSSLLWDYRQQKVNKHLTEPIIKNVSAFMNTSGGVVVVGVKDDGEVLGLDNDLAVLNKHDLDGFELVFNNAFNQMIGVEFRRFVELKFPEVDGKYICLIQVSPSDRPAYFRSKGKEKFYIRAGNASQPLTVSKAAEYIQRHFHK